MGLLHNLGQIGGHALNALPGYSTLGANITNPDINYLGAQNPPTPHNNWLGQGAPQAPSGSDPNAVLGSTLTQGLSAGAGSEPAYDPEDLAFLDSTAQLLRNMLGRTDTSLSQGLTGIDDSFNKATGLANTRQGEALSGYATNRADTLTDKRQSLGKVDTNARVLSDSIRRILGMASGSGSSAYRFAAPMAVARQASGQRSGVNETFGRNLRNIDTAEGKTKTAFEELLADLAEQRRTKESGLRAGVEEQRIGIDQDLANVAGQRQQLLGGGYAATRLAQQPYLDSINTRQGSIDSLFDQFRSPYSVKPVEVATPDMGKYTVDRAAINSNKQSGDSQYSPYAQFLLNKQDEERVV